MFAYGELKQLRKYAAQSSFDLHFMQKVSPISYLAPDGIMVFETESVGKPCCAPEVVKM